MKPTTESEDESDNEHLRHVADGARWAQIKGAYNDADTSAKEARHRGVEQLRAEYNLKIERETSVLYRYDEDAGRYKDDAERVIREHLDRVLRRHFTPGEQRQIFHRLGSGCSIPVDDFSGPDGMLCVENGVLDITSPTDPNLTAHRPDYHFRRRLPVAYDPSADCPRFEEFIEEVVHPEDRKKLQEFVGYCLHHWGMPFNRALMLTGPTQSGKSTFLDVVAALLGADNVARESLQQLANNRFSPAELDGKFVNIRSDLDSSIVRNTGRFKELAAGDAIRAERKNQDPFRFRVTQKQLYATNQVPDVDNVDQAFHERWLHVRFPDTIPRDDRDGEIDQKLTTDDELVGILNWALDGYARLMNQDGFSNERSISGKRDLWQSQGDSIDRFVDQVLVKDEQGREPDVEVYNAYCEFCDSLERQPKAKATLTKRLKQEYGVEQRRPTIGNEQVRCYCGISFGSTLPVASSPGT